MTMGGIHNRVLLNAGESVRAVLLTVWKGLEGILRGLWLVMCDSIVNSIKLTLIQVSRYMALDYGIVCP